MDHLLALIVRVADWSARLDSEFSQKVIHARVESPAQKVHPPSLKSKAFVVVVHLSAAFGLDSPALAFVELGKAELQISELTKMKREMKLAQSIAHRTFRKSGSALYFQTRTLDIAPA
jgi:hypothetical protein